MKKESCVELSVARKARLAGLLHPFHVQLFESEHVLDGIVARQMPGSNGDEHGSRRIHPLSDPVRPTGVAARQKHFADVGVRLQFIVGERSEEHTSELPSLMRISYAVFCLKKNNNSLK